MENFLAKLKPDTKITIGVSVSPNVGVEMIMVDPVQHKIMKYAHRALEYNQSTREIEDYGEFKTALTDLFNELKIKPQETKVVLNMPNVCFGHTFLPTSLDDDAVDTALVSDVEENYLFKKNTPAVSWVEVTANNSTEKRYILYSAIQEGVVNIIREIFNDLGATLIAIENTYSSLIKTLEYTQIAQDFATSGAGWNILLVSQNSYVVFSMNGYNVIEYYEDPLAIKSFNQDEVYVAISQAASSVLDKYPTDKLMIISESNEVSAEILAIQMKRAGDVTFLECNQYAKTPIMDVDYSVLPQFVKAITPEAIGVAIYNQGDFGLKLNFIKDNAIVNEELIPFMGMNVTKNQLMLYATIAGAAIVLVCFIASLAIKSYGDKLGQQKTELETKETTLNAELAELQKDKNTIDIYSAAKQIDEGMVKKVMYFNAIGADIPTKVWLTSFYTDSEGACGMTGETLSVDDVYLFFRNIKSQVKDSDLILSKLSVDDNGGLIDIESSKSVKYTFELSNKKYETNKPKEEKSKIVGEETGTEGTQPAGNGEVPQLPPGV